MYCLKRIFKKTVFIPAVILALHGLSFAGVSVTPERHIVEIAPGETAYVEYEVYNSGSDALDIVIEPQDLAKLKENKDIDIKSWLRLKQEKVTVPAQGMEKIGVNIKAPKNAVGELDSMIYLCYKEQKESMLNIRYGTPLYVLIKGTEKIKTEIRSVKAALQQNPINGQRQFIISADVLNSGNRHIRPEVWAVVKNIKTKTEQKITLNNPWPIFGGQNYVYRIIQENYDLPKGRYLCTVFFDDKKGNIETRAISFDIDKDAGLKTNERL
ncbi:MAG: hypothetical protein JW946_01755 [Candidatus Omnitrophica bacterium]|nr:hypothetical protein [Candidatus Omnitrophota bacterium]